MSPQAILLILVSTVAALLVWGLSRLLLQLFPSLQQRVQDRLIGGATADPVAAEAIYILRKKPRRLRDQQYNKLTSWERHLQFILPEMTLVFFGCLCLAAGAIGAGGVGYLAGPYLAAVAGLIAAGLPVLVVRSRLGKRE